MYTQKLKDSGYIARRVVGNGAQNNDDTRIPQEDGYNRPGLIFTSWLHRGGYTISDQIMALPGEATR
jgi:hypothetical protein